MKTLNLKINESELVVLNHIVTAMHQEIEASLKEDYGEHWVKHYDSIWDKVHELRCSNIEREQS
tara:strand:- start:42 stop:233 length:192 start_codon:yes stop_codon:yes gene_type:complete